MTPLTIENWRSLPATLILIVLSFSGFLLFYLGAPLEWAGMFTFTAIKASGQQWVFVASDHQYWRLLTPIFLHFGWMHIVFNSLWLWQLGGKIELRLGPWLLLALVVFLGIGSNSAQYWAAGPSLFGGMSGVVFGLLGFSFIYSRLLVVSELAVPNGIALFMVGWMVFCMLAPTELLGFGSIANAAHLGGLVGGCLLGLLAVGWRKL
jgi:GlpG protein